jgi:hypothetical protein
VKRRALKFALFLLLVVGGAIVNVAMGIVLASRQPRLHIIPQFPDRRFQYWPVAEAAAADRDWLDSMGWQPSERWEFEFRLQSWSFSDRRGLAYRVVGELGRFVMPTDGRGFAGSFMDEIRPAFREVRSGWPALSLRGRISNLKSMIDTQMGRTDWQPKSRMVKAERIQFPGPDPAYSAWIVPTAPIWPGFAINTVFYAGLLWMLFAAPFALRRWRRIRRGLCPKCAYPVGTSDKCTECGAAVAARPGNAACAL